MELHEWLTFVHILGAIIWVGGSLVLNAMVTRASRSLDRSAAVRLTRDVGWVGPWLIGPSTIVVIGLGIWLVVLEEEWAFSQAWILLSLVLVGVSMILNIGYSGPQGRRIAQLADQRGAENPEVHRRMGRLLALSRIDMLILLTVLWLMVFKPGV